jgi:tetratricopeptide (TPR) repeat protein
MFHPEKLSIYTDISPLVLPGILLRIMKNKIITVIAALRFNLILTVLAIGFIQCRTSAPVGSGRDFESLEKISQFEYEYSLNEGIKYKLLGDLSSSLYFFERCLEIYPYSDVSAYELANIFFLAGEIEKSLKYAKLAHALDPDNIWYYYQLALILRETNRNKEAISVYRKAVNRFPEKTELMFSLASMLTLDKQFGESLKIYDELEEKIGVDERISLPREGLYMEMGEFEAAAGEINKLIENFPDQPRYHGILAELYASIGMYDEALACYDRLFSIDPDNGIAQISVAEFFLSTGQQTEALYYLTAAFNNPALGFNEKIQFFTAILQDNGFDSNDTAMIELGEILLDNYPDQNLAKAIMSDLYFNSGNYLKAGELLYDLYSSDKNNKIYAEQLIGIISFSENFNKVTDLSAEMMERFPESVMIHYFSGIAYLMSGESGKALHIFEKALDIGEKNNQFTGNIYSNLGDIYNDRQDYPKSDKYFNLALAIDSNLVTLNNYAYYLALREEHLDMARRYSYITIREEPENASFLDTYAWILYKLGDYEEAEVYIRLAFNHGGDQSFEITKHLAAILIKLGKYNEAEKYLNMAVELAGESDAGDLDKYFNDIKGLVY